MTTAPALTTVGRVARVPAAAPDDARAHFERRLAYETDCSDVHDDWARGGAVAASFVVVDGRSAEAYAAGHLPGARSLPHAAIDEASAATLPRDRVVVTYCWGPQCNAATQAAARLAALGFAVKEMLGGYDAWCAAGHPLETGEPPEPT